MPNAHNQVWDYMYFAFTCINYFNEASSIVNN